MQNCRPFSMGAISGQEFDFIADHVSARDACDRELAELDAASDSLGTSLRGLPEPSTALPNDAAIIDRCAASVTKTLNGESSSRRWGRATSSQRLPFSITGCSKLVRGHSKCRRSLD